MHSLACLGLRRLGSGFHAYIDSLRGYQKNPLKLSNEDITKVKERWGFAFDAWGYERRTPDNADAGSSEGNLLATAVGQ